MSAAAPKPKKSVAVYIVVAVVAVLIVVIGVRQFFMPGDAGGGVSEWFGSVNTDYAWYDRGFLPTKVEYLIVYTAPLLKKNQLDPENWKVTFGNNKQFEVKDFRNRFVWVDPASGPRTVDVALTKELIDKMNARRKAAENKAFKTPEEFLAFVNSN